MSQVIKIRAATVVRHRKLDEVDPAVLLDQKELLLLIEHPFEGREG
jgi:hypothetical protein